MVALGLRMRCDAIINALIYSNDVGERSPRLNPQRVPNKIPDTINNMHQLVALERRTGGVHTAVRGAYIYENGNTGTYTYDLVL